MATTNPETAAVEAVMSATDEGLITTFAALTHRMHAAQRQTQEYGNLLAQRDLVRVEMLRRMGDAR